MKQVREILPSFFDIRHSSHSISNATCTSEMSLPISVPTRVHRRRDYARRVHRSDTWSWTPFRQRHVWSGVRRRRSHCFFVFTGQLQTYPSKRVKSKDSRISGDIYSCPFLFQRVRNQLRVKLTNKERERGS